MTTPISCSTWLRAFAAVVELLVAFAGLVAFVARFHTGPDHGLVGGLATLLFGMLATADIIAVLRECQSHWRKGE